MRRQIMMLRGVLGAILRLRVVRKEVPTLNCLNLIIGPTKSDLQRLEIKQNAQAFLQRRPRQDHSWVGGIGDRYTKVSILRS